MQFVKPQPFPEAVAKLDKKTIVSSGLNSEQWKAVPVALRERAFFSSQVESARFLQRARDGVADFLKSSRERLTSPDDGPTGEVLKTGSRADFIKQLHDFALAEGLGPLDPEDAGSIKDIRTERRLGLIFDVQTRQANDFGYWQQGQNPDILNEFPAQRFIRETEVKEPRDHHAHNENVVRLKSDLPFWTALNRDFGVPWGPWGWGCGHTVEDVDRDEAERLGLIKPGEQAQPVEVDFNEHLQAGVQNLDPELQDQLKDSFGSQIVIKDDAAHWKGQHPRKPKAAAPAAPQVAQELPTTAAFPASIDNLETVRPLGGSTGATLVRDPKTGAQFVMKKGNSAAHVREEFAADELYRSLGANVPEAKLYDGAKPVKLARFIEGRTLKEALAKATKDEKAAILAKVQEHFAADALLSNWDVAGLDLDNILIDGKGTPWRIDNGGSLRFRAQGGKKNSVEWDSFPTELWSMREAARNAQTAQLFGGLDIYAIARQVDKIDGAKLIAAAPDELREVLQTRLNNLKQIGAKALEYEGANFMAAHADQVTKHMMGLRKAEAFKGMADELIQLHPGDVRPKDKDGNYFDFLRTPTTKAKADPSESFYHDILEAVKTINHHHKTADTAYNAMKLSKALGHKPTLEKLLTGGSVAEKPMAAHYLRFISEIEAAQGKVAAQVPAFSKFQGAVMPVAPDKRTSVMSHLVNYMETHGGEWGLVEKWAQSQAGSSANLEPKAVQYWLMKSLKDAKPDSFYEPPGESEFKAVQEKLGDKFQRTFEIYHAFVQEVLGRVKFNGNDTNARLVRIIRTEPQKVKIPFPKGKSGEFKRRVNASGSVFAPIFTGTRTVTIVPHARITGIYFTERTPGLNNDFFYGDSENEFTYIAHGYKALNLGKQGDVNLSPGTDHTKWEQP